MKRVYFNFEEWEDFQNGMYETEIHEKDLLIEKAKMVLSDLNLFNDACIEVFDKWKKSTAVNMTNTGCNRRAWIGQSACSIAYNVPEILTRQAWAELTTEQREKANRIADIHILNYTRQWRKKYLELFNNAKNKDTKTEYQMKLPFDWKN